MQKPNAISKTNSQPGSEIMAVIAEIKKHLLVAILTGVIAGFVLAKVLGAIGRWMA